MVRQTGKNIWVGISDRGEENLWRLVSDAFYFNPNEDGTLFKWRAGEPNNHKGEQCAVAYLDNTLIDDKCSDHYHGLCEIKVFDCYNGLLLFIVL